MTRRLVLAMTVVAGLVAIALAIPLAVNAVNDVRDDFVSRLEILTLGTASVLASQPREEWAASVDEAARASGARVVVVDANRSLIVDSDKSALVRNFDRPEIAQALNGRLDSDVRPSTTLGTDLRFVAAPVVHDNKVVAAVRYSLPESAVDARARETVLWLVLFVVAVMVGAGLLAWLIARSIAGPLETLAGVAADLPDDLTLRARTDDGPREVRSVATALNATAERLGGLLQRQQRVAADASHHLRTPLTGVRLRLEAIEDVSDQPDVRAQAVAATAEVDRLTRRIDQILVLARADAGAGRSDIVRADEIVHDRVDAARILAGDRGIDIESDIAPLAIAAPPGVLARVVDELIGNALAYADSRISVSLQQRDADVLLSVDDDGPGVAEPEQTAIFERFARGSDAVAGGSGLGLALVRESARMCGGDAWAESSPLGGLRVLVVWPIAEDPPHARS